MTHSSELVIVGAGLAGLAAACFAARRGIRVRVIAASGGELSFASGALDVLGRRPAAEAHPVVRVWDEVERLIAVDPRHPYALAGRETVDGALSELLEILAEQGLPYRGEPRCNSWLPTPAGTFKPTFRMPQSMWPAVAAGKRRAPVLVAGFQGMKEFSPRLIAAMAGARMGRVTPLQLPFPERSYGFERNNLLMASALETEPVRERVAAMIREHRAAAQAVAMPAVLGCKHSLEVVSDLERRIGLPIFEIPTLPPSVPGTRLRNALTRALQELKVEILSPHKVERAVVRNSRVEALLFPMAGQLHRLQAKGFILATGRFLGGGLKAARDGIREPIFGLPVRQPPARVHWHREDFFDPAGHPVNRAGVVVDRSFRPADEKGRPLHHNLFAAGTLLAHQDWMATMSGAGLAVSSALAAVSSFRERFAG